MSFFGIGQKNQQPSDVRVTQGGVPLDAVSRLRRMRGEGGAPLFTSDLSVSEFVLLEQMGWRPLGLVLGSSIYHVGIQYGNFYQNQELQYLTAAMYEARDLAMNRMEEEADVLGADGIVGVRLEVGGYDWAENALEFTAIGTAVKAPAELGHVAHARQQAVHVGLLRARLLQARHLDGLRAARARPRQLRVPHRAPGLLADDAHARHERRAATTTPKRSTTRASLR